MVIVDSSIIKCIIIVVDYNNQSLSYNLQQIAMFKKEYNFIFTSSSELAFGPMSLSSFVEKEIPECELCIFWSVSIVVSLSSVSLVVCSIPVECFSFL
jgi:hypothetical protein